MCCAYVEYKIIDHIGKDEILCSCGFFVPFLSVAMRVHILKEGDRMGHKDDVLMDSNYYMKLK